MAITAKDVSDLRAKTGVGMMDCKKALTETNGNVEEAVKLLKERGLVIAAKKAERVTAEGIVDILFDEGSNTAVMLEVNAETDFVAKNEQFQGFVKECLKVILKEKPADVAELLTKKYTDGSMTVDEALKDQIAQIKENITLRRLAIVEGDLYTYVHNKGAIGAIVKVDADDKVKADAGFMEFKKNLALQIASMKPVYITRDEISAEAIAEERKNIIEKINEDPETEQKMAKVPEDRREGIMTKMIEGKIEKYYANSCLLEQEYVKEDKMTVAEYIEDFKKQAGGEVKIAEFKRFEKGEGIQKREDNFAEEIAQLTGQ